MIAQSLFQEHRARPGTESLLALLRACADPVYNICFQVLRHRQDAEDAAQIVLLKIVSQARNASEIDRFDRWLYRVAFNTALKDRTQRDRRTSREHRKALMNPSEDLPDEVRDAVVEAVGRLDEDLRCLVVQHFFERRSLGEIARERKCSAVAIWKRIERAKTMIRHILTGAGALVAIAGMNQVFASCEFVRAPSTLISEATVRKAVAAAGSPALVGGMLMAGKGISVALIAALSIALFVLGTGGALLLRSSAERPVPMTARFEATKTAPGSAERDPSTAVSGPQVSPTLVPSKDLAAELKDLRVLLCEAKSEKDQTRAQELYRRLLEQQRALRPAAFADLPVLFNFLRSEQGEVFSDLLLLFLGAEFTASGYITTRVATDLPPEFVAGMANLVTTGNKTQKLAVIRWFLAMAPEGKERELLADRSLDLLARGSDPEILSALVDTFQVKVPDLNEKLEQRLDLIEGIWGRPLHFKVRIDCLLALSRMKSTAAESLFIQRTQNVLQTNDAQVAPYIPWVLGNRLQALTPGEEDPYLPVFEIALMRTTNSNVFARYLDLALMLPPSKAAPLLEDARSRCPTPEIQSGVDHALALLRAGETRTTVLQRALRSNP